MHFTFSHETFSVNNHPQPFQNVNQKVKHTSNLYILLLPGEVLAVAVLVSPLEVLELRAGPGVLEVLVLLGGILLRVVDAVLHHVLEATDEAYWKKKKKRKKEHSE